MLVGRETLVVYRAQPDLLTLEWFRDHWRDTGLADHGLSPAIETGHPIFASGSTSSGVDRAFPRLGIAHVVDRTVSDSGIGSGFLEFRPRDEFRNMLHNYKRALPEQHRSPDRIVDALTAAEVVQRWIEFVESTVVIAGFCAGGAGWMDARRLYQSIDAQLRPFALDVHREFTGVKVQLEGPRQADIEYNGEHGPLYGFEIAITIRQPRRTYRALRPYEAPPVARFDVHMEQSRTVWGQRPGEFGFGGE